MWLRLPPNFSKWSCQHKYNHHDDETSATSDVKPTKKNSPSTNFYSETDWNPDMRRRRISRCSARARGGEHDGGSSHQVSLPRRQACAPLVASTRARVGSHHPTRPGVCIGRTSDGTPRCLPVGPTGTAVPIRAAPAPWLLSAAASAVARPCPCFLGGWGSTRPTKPQAGPTTAWAATPAAPSTTGRRGGPPLPWTHVSRRALIRVVAARGHVARAAARRALRVSRRGGRTPPACGSPLAGAPAARRRRAGVGDGRARARRRAAGRPAPRRWRRRRAAAGPPAPPGAWGGE